MFSLTVTWACNHRCGGDAHWPAARNGSQSRRPGLCMQQRRRDEAAAALPRGGSGAIRLLATPLVAAILTLFPPNLPASHPVSMAAGASPSGAALFKKACIGCHDGGGNILQPGASLFTADLERNGIATEEEIYKITYFGKGRMPGYGEKCAPRGQCTFGPRLEEDEIKQLAEFVKLQAAGGWPKIEVLGEDQ